MCIILIFKLIRVIKGVMMPSHASAVNMTHVYDLRLLIVSCIDWYGQRLENSPSHILQIWVKFKVLISPWSSRLTHGLTSDMTERGGGQGCSSFQHRHIKLSPMHRIQIHLTQPSLFRDFSGCIPRGVHGFGSIWRQTQRQSLTQRHLQMIFSTGAITADWPRLVG